MPGGPVRERRRTSTLHKRERTRSITPARPTKEVRGEGRLEGGAACGAACGEGCCNGCCNGCCHEPALLSSTSGCIALTEGGTDGRGLGGMAGTGGGGWAVTISTSGRSEIDVASVVSPLSEPRSNEIMISEGTGTDGDASLGAKERHRLDQDHVAVIRKGENESTFIISQDKQRDLTTVMRLKAAAMILGGPTLALAGLGYWLLVLAARGHAG